MLTVGTYHLQLLDSVRGIVVGSTSEEEALLAHVLDASANPDDDTFAMALRSVQPAQNLLVSLTPVAETGSDTHAVVGAVDTLTVVRVPWNDLALAAETLRGLRADWRPPKGHQLFRPEPLGPLPSRDDIDALIELEREAVAIDEADADAHVGSEPLDLIEQRRRFLARCDALSLFDRHRFVSDSGGDARDNAMVNLGLRVLPEVRRAGLGLRNWELVNPNQSVLESGVAIDYVRHQLWPAGDSGRESALAARSLLMGSGDLDGAQGLLIQRVGGETYTVAWRDDGGGPAVLGVSAAR